MVGLTSTDQVNRLSILNKTNTSKEKASLGYLLVKQIQYKVTLRLLALP
jgi:hypothetical protein